MRVFEVVTTNTGKTHDTGQAHDTGQTHDTGQAHDTGQTHDKHIDTHDKHIDTRKGSKKFRQEEKQEFWTRITLLSL